MVNFHVPSLYVSDVSARIIIIMQSEERFAKCIQFDTLQWGRINLIQLNRP